MRNTTHTVQWIVLVATLCCWGCKADDPHPLPPGTEVSGKVQNSMVRLVVYIPQGKQTGEAIEVADTGKETAYRWAVSPGEYDVYAYITGARAHVAKVTVGQEPIVVDVPDNLAWKEALDVHAGTKATLAKPQSGL